MLNNVGNMGKERRMEGKENCGKEGKKKERKEIRRVNRRKEV